MKYDSWKIQHGGKNAVSKEISRHQVNYKTCSKGLQSDDIDDKLGDLFISAEFPFTFVKLEEFATFCAALNPHYTVPSIFKGPHSGRRIANFTLTTCGDWNITNKIVRIGTIR